MLRVLLSGRGLCDELITRPEESCIDAVYTNKNNTYIHNNTQTYVALSLHFEFDESSRRRVPLPVAARSKA